MITLVIIFFIAYRCVKGLSFISLHGSNVLIIIKAKYYFFLIERNDKNMVPHMIEADDTRSLENHITAILAYLGDWNPE